MTGKTHGASTFTLTTPSDTELQMSRVFDAPAALVFEAYTTPEHVKRWWAAPDVEWLACDIDLRVGGAWRWGIRDTDGTKVVFFGTYEAIDRPGRIDHTEIFEPFPDEVSHVIVTLEEDAGRTLLTSTSRYSSKEVRDMVISTGAGEGAALVFERMAELLAELG